MDEEHVIHQMRETILNLIENEDPSEVSQIDIDMIKSSDDLLRRFALHESACRNRPGENDWQSINIDFACDLLMKTLKWRKSFGIHEMKDSDFPREFYKMDLFSYSLDLEKKSLVIFVKARKYRAISNDTRQLFIRGIIYEIEKRIQYFQREYTSGIMEFYTAIVFDCSDIGYSNVDIQLLISFISIISNHFPMIVNDIFLYSIPWFARYLVPIVIKAIPEVIARKIKQVTKSQAETTIGHLLPQSMGGSSSINPDLEVPQASVSLEEWIQKCTLTPQDQEKMREYICSVYLKA